MTNLFFRNGNSRRKKWMIVQSANDSWISIQIYMNFAWCSGRPLNRNRKLRCRLGHWVKSCWKSAVRSTCPKRTSWRRVIPGFGHTWRGDSTFRFMRIHTSTVDCLRMVTHIAHPCRERIWFWHRLRVETQIIKLCWANPWLAFGRRQGIRGGTCFRYAVGALHSASHWTTCQFWQYGGDAQFGMLQPSVWMTTSDCRLRCVKREMPWNRYIGSARSLHVCGTPAPRVDSAPRPWISVQRRPIRRSC